MSTDDELRDLFVFHVSKEQVQISEATLPQSAAEPVAEPEAVVDEEAAMPPHNLPAEEAYGFLRVLRAAPRLIRIRSMVRLPVLEVQRKRPHPRPLQPIWSPPASAWM